MLALVNNELMPVEEASIGITDLAILRGYGIFDFFRLSDGVPLFMDDHINRFFASADKVRLRVPLTRSELSASLFELFEKNNMSVSGIRMILTGGYTPNGYEPGKPNLIITQEPISFPDKEKVANGVKLITHEYLRDIPDVKSINYMTGIWLGEKIAQSGAYDVLYLDKGNVLELTRSNIFIVTKDQVIVTPKELVLHGITRKHVLKAIQHLYKIEERPITLDELLQAEEAFLTGTTKRVLPFVQVDQHIIGQGAPGKVTKNIIQQFLALESIYVANYRQ